jgi:putative chitinase
MTLTELLGGNGAALVPAMARYAITSPLEQAHFLAQVAHESMGFTRLVENLNYSAEGLHGTWPGRFPTLADAQPYARQPEKIANFVYSDRLGNGPPSSGDGWRFRGRGFIQTTGLHNYLDASLAIFGDRRLVVEPEQLAEPVTAASAAGRFWTEHRLGSPAMRDDLVAVTHGVNGGTIGLSGRHAWLLKFKAALGVSP